MKIVEKKTIFLKDPVKVCMHNEFTAVKFILGILNNKLHLFEADLKEIKRTYSGKLPIFKDVFLIIQYENV